jgi:hypothetical protein
MPMVRAQVWPALIGKLVRSLDQTTVTNLSAKSEALSAQS